jgi:hypothetical protein
MTRPIVAWIPRPRPPDQQQSAAPPAGPGTQSAAADLQLEIDASVAAVRLAAHLPIPAPLSWAVHVTLAAMLTTLALDHNVRPAEITLGALAGACRTPKASAASRIDRAFTGRPGYPPGSWVVALFGLDTAAPLLTDLAVKHGPRTLVHQLTDPRP